jgi:hypothetical protein
MDVTRATETKGAVGDRRQIRAGGRGMLNISE